MNLETCGSPKTCKSGLSCWVCPLLLIRLTTRSSCQPQMVKDISGTALQCFESYLSDRSFKVSRRGVQVTTSSYRSASGLSSWTTSLLCLHGFTRKHGFSYHCYADDTQLYLSFHPDDLTIAARISACLTNISFWMKDHHLQLNLVKTELLVVPAKPIVSSQFHHPARHINHNSFKNSQKPWSYDWWSADFLS